MTNPEQLKYATSHEWVKVDESGELTIGITDHAQDQLGDVVFADLPALEQTMSAQQACMLLESVKAASDIYMPVSGKITAVNTALEDTPELINEDAYGKGWLFRMVPENQADLEKLLSLSEYESSLDE
ncbi:MAG: glycine cleavage system protein GcvH [Piscirickettsiaceae bacterium]|mgnify:CR=1 FL=1|jgi:glycine cleavage system H protein|nr:glycine cleavage system protein GcvH [Piscirickettsiaceae bacterium]